MTAESLLVTYIQVGVAIAGFSGIVVALGGRAQGEWSYHDRQLLHALLGTSGGCALLSALPLLLGATGIAERTVWSISSGCSVILQLGLMAARATNIVRDAETVARERWVIIVAFGGGLTFVVAQLINCVWLGEAWPHLAAITWHLGLAFVVFVRLVLPVTRT